MVVLAGVPDGRVGLFPDELDLGSVLDRWAAATSSPDRLHVVVTDPADATVAWRALGSLVGLRRRPAHRCRTQPASSSRRTRPRCG